MFRLVRRLLEKKEAENGSLRPLDKAQLTRLQDDKERRYAEEAHQQQGAARSCASTTASTREQPSVP